MPAPVGMTEEGENAQVTPAGWPVHDNAVEELKPLKPVTVTGTVTELDCPAGPRGMTTSMPRGPTSKSFTSVVVSLELLPRAGSPSSAEAVKVCSCDAISPGFTLMMKLAVAPEINV